MSGYRAFDNDQEGGTDEGQEGWPHVYGDFFTTFEMSKEEGEESAPRETALFYDVDVPAEADPGGKVPLEEDPSYEEPVRPEAAVPIVEARQRLALIQSAEGRESLMYLLAEIGAYQALGS
ncbi:hypothetical protein JG688_00004038 [Phytophthora aleatoria]|uniref:Uncharacterized protein n=1 Tax=Phytophthora aleatoria TaxID=2496075 RepID=A0A8J5JEC7_9STRA|nr:hypothetical protein JG688_00004038 [Phytophthora aleatoria]